MCGIAGYIDLKNKIDLALIKKMTNIMPHRGPDGEGYYFDSDVALGHRRLSIIDIAGGKQPMNYGGSRYWITYNGEIYNFQDLRQQLIKKGYNFITRSDTETILAAYEEYGESCVDYLRGMFAFAIWDKVDRRLFLARDRLGKKPLYYHMSPNLFVFGSEIKVLLQHDAISREVDLQAIADYFTYNYIPFPRTIFKSISKLLPGHTLIIQCDEDEKLSFSQNEYWDLSYSPDFDSSEEQWCEALRDKLSEATRLRMISDVPLGAFLSGGVDSSAVVAFMAKAQSTPVKTFSIGFKEEDFSETHYARQISECFGTEHHEFIIEPDAIEVLPKLAWEYDEPFADSSAIPTYYVSKLAREYVTVILSGDGGDETFAGYRRYPWATKMHRYDLFPNFCKKILFGIPSSLMLDGMKGKGMLRHLSRPPFERYAGLNTFGETSYLEKLFSSELKSSLRGEFSESYPDFSLSKHYYDHCNIDDYLTRLQYLDTKVYLAEDILTKVDRASMFCSLETRAPLLDHEVLELAAKIPSQLKIKGGVTKYILKKALQPLLPENILYRKKMGFGVPLVHWFKKDLINYSYDVLLSSSALQRGYFDSSYIKTILEIHKKRGRDMSPQIWALLFFEHWCQNWLS